MLQFGILPQIAGKQWRCIGLWLYFDCKLFRQKRGSLWTQCYKHLPHLVYFNLSYKYNLFDSVVLKYLYSATLSEHKVTLFIPVLYYYFPFWLWLKNVASDISDFGFFASFLKVSYCGIYILSRYLKSSEETTNLRFH